MRAAVVSTGGFVAGLLPGVDLTGLTDLVVGFVPLVPACAPSDSLPCPLTFVGVARCGVLGVLARGDFRGEPGIFSGWGVARVARRGEATNGGVFKLKININVMNMHIFH